MRCLSLILSLFIFHAAYAQQSQNVTLLCNWSDTANIRPTAEGWRYNDVWGFAINGKEYAALGSTEGVHIIDIDECKQVVFYPGKAGGPTIVHRDYKTYSHYLYAVADEGLSNLQVFDLNYLPDSLHLVYESDPLELMQAHNIFIDTAKATLYTCLPKSSSNSDYLKVYSIQDPVNPVLLTKYNLHEGVHDVYVRNDTAFCSSGFYGYEIVDFNSHDQNYQNIGEMHFYPFQGYNHSSWINEKGIGVMADETFGMPVKVIDTRDLLNIHVLSNFSPRPGDSTCIPHNPYLIGNNAFVSYYFDGLQIYDISDPENPIRTGYYDTYPGNAFSGFGGAWGCYPFLPSGRVLVSDMETGLYVFDASLALGVHDSNLPQGSLGIYPNPASDKVSLRLPKTETGHAAIKLYDVSGQLIRQYPLQRIDNSFQPIELTLPGNLPAGTYFISIKTGAHFYKEKFTKQ